MSPLDLDTGTTAWLLASSALVLLMTPGLAFFYGGMVRAKSVLNMMMMSFGALASISVVWVLWGYSMSFGDDWFSGLVGNPFKHFGLHGLTSATNTLVVQGSQNGTYPALAFVAFQAVFAIITVALISGAIADRAKFGTWMIFTVVWGTLVYFPVAHWVFDFSGFSGPSHVGGWVANQLKAIDFAGGTAVHINAGAAGLALALVVGKRIGFQRDPMRPHNLTLVMLGAGLLWFGWFGFNAGSAVAANGAAASTWVNTMVATAAACLGWLITERIRDGHATSLGAASGIVAGLVAITPSCSSVSPIGAIILGAVAGALCSIAIGLKYKLGYDDSLDVVGVHMIGGLWGTLAVGLFATATEPAAVNGLFYGGGFDQLWRQAVGAFAVMFFSFGVTWVIGTVLHKTVGFRVSAEEELAGVDENEHAETAYDFGAFGGSLRGVMGGGPTVRPAHAADPNQNVTAVPSGGGTPEGLPADGTPEGSRGTGTAGGTPADEEVKA